MLICNLVQNVNNRRVSLHFSVILDHDFLLYKLLKTKITYARTWWAFENINLKNPCLLFHSKNKSNVTKCELAGDFESIQARGLHPVPLFRDFIQWNPKWRTIRDQDIQESKFGSQGFGIGANQGGLLYKRDHPSTACVMKITRVMHWFILSFVTCIFANENRKKPTGQGNLPNRTSWTYSHACK